jgi:hypothetical protein
MQVLGKTGEVTLVDVVQCHHVDRFVSGALPRHENNAEVKQRGILKGRSRIEERR